MNSPTRNKTTTILDPVTVREWLDYLAEIEGVPAEENDWCGQGPPDWNFPIVNVTFWEALEYAKWRTKKAPKGVSYRLPTSDEMAAAMATLPGKDDPAWVETPLEDMPEVGDPRIPQNADGLKDLIGVVWWWTSTKDRFFRVVRGGGWYNTVRHVRPAKRFWIKPRLRFDSVGLRLVKEVTP